MTEALKPCPFCGGKDVDGEMHEDGRLHCYRCGANGPAMPYARDDKFPTWNTRADLVDPAAIREAALREAANVDIPYFDDDGELHSRKLSFMQRNSILALIQVSASQNDKKEG